MNSRTVNSRTMKTTEMTGGKNFLIWMGLWIAALMVLLPALAGS